MESDKNIEIQCVEIKQPIDVFYSGKIAWDDLLKIAYSDIRHIEEETDLYFGIQRSLSPNRLKEISKYVSFTDATFPTSVVLSIKSKDEEGESVIESYSDGKLIIKNKKDIAKIIDGQHRVFGLKKYIESNGLFNSDFVFDLIVTVFIDMDPEDEAMVFSTINKAQTKVNKSLVYDLYSLAESRSPQRTCHNIVKYLNSEQTPFYNKIKRLGTAISKNETITQATLVENILKYISKEPMVERDKMIKGEELKKAEGTERERYFFRNWFIDKEDSKILKQLLNYFVSVETKWPKAWNDDTKILSKSTGIIALMRFLKNIVSYYEMDKIITIDEFNSVFSKINIKDDEFTNDNYKAGGVGQSQLYKELIKPFECQKEHEDTDEIVKNLSINQGGTGRHKCASCAYEEGYKDGDEGKGKRSYDEVNNDLLFSQKGKRRHRSTNEAYDLGYEDGIKSKDVS